MNTRPIWATFAGALLLAVAGCASAPSSSTSPASSTEPAPAPAEGSPVCTLGMDQTCNDDVAMSSLHGACLPDGTCACKDGFTKNEATGHCK